MADKRELKCTVPQFTGKESVLGYAWGCYDKKPDITEFKRLPSVNSKGYTLEWDTQESNVDSMPGFATMNLATTQNFSITGEGVCLTKGLGAERLKEITKFTFDPASTKSKDQPALWVILVMPDISIIAYMNITENSRPSAESNAVQEFNLSANLAYSYFAIDIRDTEEIASNLSEEFFDTEFSIRPAEGTETRNASSKGSK